MRILICYPGHAISTYDVARGWHRGLKSLGNEVFALEYEYNVPFYGAVCKYWKDRNEDFQPNMRDVFWLASQDLVCKAIECMPLDFVFIITGLLHHPRVFDLLRKIRVPTVLLFTESPYNDELAEEMLPLVDVIFTNDQSSVDNFRERNPYSYYMPHSYDPATHHPPDGEILGEECQHDVFFMGSLYEERKALFATLLPKLEGVKIDIWGTVLNKTGGMEGAITNDEIVKHYWGSKIVLSPNRTTADYFAKTQLTDPAWSLGPRVYEVAACGTFQLTDTGRPEISTVFGDAIPTYEDAEGLAKLIHHYLEHPEEAKLRANEARKLVAPCSFANRTTEILLPTIEEVLEGG